MEMLIKLALMFSKLSLFSFGGGYVMIPIAMKELEANGWATASELTDIIAIAGMSPGPVAVNSAVGIGYKVAGIKGVAAAFLGITLPTTILVIIVAVFFFRIYKHPKVKAAFYGLRPVITGIIIYAAVSFALKNNVVAAEAGKVIKSGYNIFFMGKHLFELKSVIITCLSFTVLIKTKIHPVFVIIGAGMLGALIF